MRKVLFVAVLALLGMFAYQNQVLAWPDLPASPPLYEVHYVYAGNNTAYWYATFETDGDNDLPPGYTVQPDIRYNAWCVDEQTQNTNVYKDVAMSYTLEPGRANYDTWKSVNWYLNNRVAGVSTQEVIWTILSRDASYAPMHVNNGGLGSHDFYSDAAVKAAVDAAEAAGATYAPQYGDTVAVLLQDGQDTIIEVENPVPEPGTLLLLGSGLVGLAGYGKVRLRRRKKA